MLFSDAKEFILIPPEILVKIFCNLQFIDLLACTETCKKWNDLIKSRIFPKRSIHLTAYSNDQFTTLQKILDSTYRTFHGGITLKNLEKIPSLNFYEGITNLRLENLSSSILEDELIANVNRYDHIYSFSLQGSHVRLTTMGLSKLAVLEKLVYLNLSNYDLLHDEIFLLFLSRTPNLNSLILDNCCLNYAGDSGIKLKSDSIIQVCGYLPLKELSLNSSGIDDEFMNQLGKVTNLSKLSISNCSSVSLRGFYQFFSKQNSLEYLDLSFCRRIFMDYNPSNSPYNIIFLSNLISINLSGLSIHNKGFPLIMKNLKSIKRLVLNNVDVPNSIIFNSITQISNEFVQLELGNCEITEKYISLISNLSTLKILKLDIRSDGVYSKLCDNNFFNSLEELYLNFNSIESVIVFNYLCKFSTLKILWLENGKFFLESYNSSIPNLTYLKFANILFTSKKDIINILIHQPKLETLILQGMAQINNEVIRIIISSLKYLKYIDLSDWTNIGGDCLNYILKGNCKRLRVLNGIKSLKNMLLQEKNDETHKFIFL
ncbi:uncharacterized protein [Lepeophtheirus salmonis]|uniref:uncharacterized protein isoform X1 n=1 Tax=Lepeophtheirus salmonis TaxID=72036 RepID=UPI003AF395CD